MTAPREEWSTGQPWPSVSVVLPVRNEADTVAGAITSAVAQEYPGPLEVIVADGASTDGTKETIEAFATRGGRVSLVDNHASTTPAGLNAAIRASQGEVIVRCDAHSILPPTYVRQAVETLIATGADNVGGIQAAVGHGPTQRAIAWAMSNPLGVGNSRFHYGGSPGPIDTAYLGVFRRDVFDRVGFFDESLIRNQDYEMNYRIRQAGGLVYFDPRLRVEYRPRRTLGALGSQYWQYGRWKWRVARKHPESVQLRHLAPPALIIGLIGSLIAGVALPTWTGVLTPFAYLAVLTGVSIWAALRRRDPALLLVGPALATMHVSWGLGFLTALLFRRPN